VIARLFGNQAPRLPQQQTQNQSPPAERSLTVNQTVDNLDDLEPYWLAELRLVFKTTNRNDLCDKLHSISLKFPVATVENCFANFAFRLVSSKSESGNILAINTAKSYLITVAKRLGGRLGSEDPSSLDVETLENLYVEILEDADEASGAKKQRRQIARALREFHYYLVQVYGYEAINAREVLGFGKGLVPVDANLIQFDEYHRIYNFIPQLIKHDHPRMTAQDKFINAAQLIFMLAFRCGLRRMEVLKLKIEDFKEASLAELLIRPNDARRLKTKSSTRKLPIHHLLTNTELSALRNWKKQRLSELAVNGLKHEQFLFGIPELGYAFIPQETLFPIIHQAMRSVTQDSTLRFHHLRHSFATWTFLRLMLADMPKIPVLFPRQPETQQYLEDSKVFKRRLYGLNDPTRKHVYSVASLLGHSGPEISLEHYVHCCDLLLAAWLSEDLSAPTQNMVRMQSDRAQSTGYRWTLHGIHQTSFQLLKKRWPKLVSKPSSPVAGTLKIQASPLRQGVEALGDAKIFQKMYDLLYQHGMHGTSLDELAIEAGYSEIFVQAVFQQMILTRDMQVDRGGKGYRHRMVEEVLDRRYTDQIKRLACPVAPHSAKDKAIQASLAPKFIMAMKTKPDLCRQVFDYYINHAWQSRNDLVFKNPYTPQSALQFMEFLDLIGIKKSSLRFVSYDTALRSSSLANWKEKLGLSFRHKVEKLAPPRLPNTSAKQWLGIKPIFEDESNLHQKGGVEVSSIAFRFLMVLSAAILFSI
jgi:integrase